MYEARLQETICIAHRIPTAEGGLGPLHGHNWVVEAVVGAVALDARGLVADPAALDAALHRVVDPLDHQTLNELEVLAGLPLSAVGVARYVAERLAGLLPGGRLRVLSVTVADGALRAATFRPAVRR